MEFICYKDGKSTIEHDIHNLSKCNAITVCRGVKKIYKIKVYVVSGKKRRLVLANSKYSEEILDFVTDEVCENLKPFGHTASFSSIFYTGYGINITIIDNSNSTDTLSKEMFHADMLSAIDFGSEGPVTIETSDGKKIQIQMTIEGSSIICPYPSEFDVL